MAEVKWAVVADLSDEGIQQLIENKANPKLIKDGRAWYKGFHVWVDTLLEAKKIQREANKYAYRRGTALKKYQPEADKQTCYYLIHMRTDDPEFSTAADWLQNEDWFEKIKAADRCSGTIHEYTDHGTHEGGVKILRPGKRYTWTQPAVIKPIAATIVWDPTPSLSQDEVDDMLYINFPDDFEK